MSLTMYRVVWTFDLIADTPQAAAEMALSELFDPDSISVRFAVTDHDSGETTPCAVTPPLLY